MLTSLNFLDKGRQFPPPSEEKRLARYTHNKRIFDNEHGRVYDQQLRRIERVIGNLAEIISYPIVLNYQKKMSLKTADFLFMEPPTFESEKQQETVDDIVNESGLLQLGYQGAIDASRYGDAVLKIDKNDSGQGVIGISSPRYLFIVVDPEDMKRVTHYVLAWEVVDKGSAQTEAEAKRYLVTKIFDNKWTYEFRKYALTREGRIGALLEQREPTPTGLDDFAVIPIPNVLTADGVYGIDDYEDVDSIISEIEIRTAQISKVLDVHSNPSMSGPEDYMDTNSAGESKFKPGRYYPRYDNNQAPVEYITWDASLDANFEQIEKLIKHLSVISEMGAAILNTDFKTGAIPSGSALKRLYINVLAKVSRVRNNFDTGLKKAIALASQIGRTQVDASEITIHWQDGLPDDPKETAEIINLRTAGAQTMSTERVLIENDKLDQASADKELETIWNEQSQSMGLPTFTPAAGDLEGAAELTGADADLSYNGAQVQSALTIAEQVAQKKLSRDAAIRLLVKMLKVPREEAEAIIDAQLTIEVETDG